MKTNKQIAKILIPVIAVFLINGCSNTEYYAMGHTWNFNVNDTYYVVEYISSTIEKITLQVETTIIDENEWFPIYILDTDKIKYVTIDGVEYKQLSYGKYYGGAVVTGTYEIDVFFEHITSKDSYSISLDIIGIYHPPLLNPVYFHYIDLKIKDT